MMRPANIKNGSGFALNQSLQTSPLVPRPHLGVKYGVNNKNKFRSRHSQAATRFEYSEGILFSYTNIVEPSSC